MLCGSCVENFGQESHGGQHCIKCGTAFGADFGLPPIAVGSFLALAALGVGLVAWMLRKPLLRFKRQVYTNARILLGLAQVCLCDLCLLVP